MAEDRLSELEGLTVGTSPTEKRRKIWSPCSLHKKPGEAAETATAELYLSQPWAETGPGAESDVMGQYENWRSKIPHRAATQPAQLAAAERNEEPVSKATRSQSEKKTRKAMSKLGLGQVTGVTRVTVWTPKNIPFVIIKP